MIKYILQKFRYCIALLFGLFWTSWVIVMDFLLIWKHPIKYFQSPSTIKMPSCVNESKYGRSCIRTIQTSKGVNIEAAEMNIHYMISGEKNSKTILFIHGFPEFWYSYRYQIPYFNKRYRVIAIDLRGYGKSSKPSAISDYQMKHLTNDIKGLFDELNIDKAIVVAHDWGGAVAWNFERVFPEKVEKLITLNIPETRAFYRVIRSNMRQFLSSWYIMFFQMPFIPEWKLSRFDMAFIKSAFTSSTMGVQKTKMDDSDIDAFKANMAQTGALSCGINYYRAALRYGPSSSNSSVISHRNNSTISEKRYMLIFGDKDGALVKQCALETKALVPGLTLKLLPGISHWVQQDDPDTVNKLMEEFIED